MEGDGGKVLLSPLLSRISSHQKEHPPVGSGTQRLEVCPERVVPKSSKYAKGASGKAPFDSGHFGKRKPVNAGFKKNGLEV